MATEKYTGSAGWNEIIGGDGGITRVDPTNHNDVYEEYADVSLKISTNAGSTFTSITSGIAANTVNFYAPYVLDSTGNVYFGTDYLNFSSNHGSSWSQIGTPGPTTSTRATTPSTPSRWTRSTNDATSSTSPPAARCSSLRMAGRRQ